MTTVFEKPRSLTDAVLHYCPGCTHGIVHRLVAECIDELGIETFRGCDNTNMWYCGPYIVEEYIQGNTKSYIPNPHYYDAANVSRFARPRSPRA